MYILDSNQFDLNQISAGMGSACYNAYQTVAQKDAPGLGQNLVIIFFPVIGLFGVIGYRMGLRAAVISICGDSFDATEKQYCLSNPSTCMNPELKKPA